MPSKLVLTNHTKQQLFVIGASGGDFGTSVTQKTVDVNATAEVGELSKPTNGFSDHWGWIFIGTGWNEPKYQLYIAAGTVRGVFDYAVQEYENGVNRNGDTIKDTEVSKTGKMPDETVYYAIDEPDQN